MCVFICPFIHVNGGWEAEQETHTPVSFEGTHVLSDLKPPMRPPYLLWEFHNFPEVPIQGQTFNAVPLDMF